MQLAFEGELFLGQTAPFADLSYIESHPPPDIHASKGTGLLPIVLQTMSLILLDLSPVGSDSSGWARAAGLGELAPAQRECAFVDFDGQAMLRTCSE